MSVFSHEFADIIFCKYLDILEIIMGCRSDPFTLIDLELPTNFYMIACTDIRILKKEKIVHLPSWWSKLLDIGSDMNFIGSDMI